MDLSGYKLPELKIVRPISERQFLIAEFTKKINQEREGTQYKQLPIQAIAKKLVHLKNMEELRFFYKSCDEAKCGFSRAFFGNLKVK